MSVFRRAGASGTPGSQSKPNLLPISLVAQSRRPYGFRHVVNKIQGRVWTPQGLFAQVADRAMPAVDIGHSQETFHVPLDVTSDEEDDEEDPNAPKKILQWRRWSEEVIPSMIEPYMKLLSDTEGLQNVDRVRGHKGCGGCSSGRLFEVSCIYFERIEKIVLCSCSSLALQLLCRGLFPCAPVEPSLAVDLNLLDFAKELFVNSAPNTTAWCETLEGFLSARKFKLKTRNSLRGRFGNALHWYAILINIKNLMVKDYLDMIRGSLFSGVEDIQMEDSEDIQMEYADERNISEEQSDTPMSGPPQDRPSEYLREHCPLCFGGENWSQKDEVVDSIVCLDACFTQKRRKATHKGWNAPKVHPETVFVPQVDVDLMEKVVDERRPPKNKSTRENPPQSTDTDYEEGIKVPTSVLNECNDSFVAADERRVKASTKFFADTGLMALLCRHDWVLWLANMTSAGEKQHYALCLLEKLFQHIPDSMRIGVLYDIGCQLHRSCNKYGFLENFLDRIVFGISVFHAYGHQWPCQLIYHPCKCVGFGLTDGEGCERFWSSIKLLIPSCRVSGFFTRIFTIDTQVKHLDGKSLLGLGNWLGRKWIVTFQRKEKAVLELQKIYEKGYTEQQLRDEWDCQVEEQTKPLKKQSKGLADKEIHEIIALTHSLESLKKEAHDFEQMLSTGVYEDGLDAVAANDLLQEVDAKISRLTRTIANKRGKLSVDGRLSLQKLLGNEFLRTRMNALALKQRIRDRLRHRKFEMANLERAYRTTVNHSKLESHATQQIKRKEPGILTLARNYNKLCVTLKTLHAKHEAPRGSIVPPEIVIEGLFKLDVDDDIWQDIGLTDNSDGAYQVPGWLGNDDIRLGIKSLLELDRCNKEQRRLKKEAVSMQQWFREEWAVVIKALEVSQDDVKLVYQLLERKQWLARLWFNWEPKIRVFSDHFDTPWGPSLNDWNEVKAFEQNERMVYEREIGGGNKGTGADSGDEGSVWSDDETGMHDAELIDNLEEMM